MDQEIHAQRAWMDFKHYTSKGYEGLKDVKYYNDIPYILSC